MKILFAVPRSFNPKQMYREYPLGVGFLGTILKQQGHEVHIFDQNAEGANDAALLKLVADFNPVAVGFSVITPNYPVARQQIRALKLKYPDLRLIAGGIHASMFPEDLVADGVDAVVLGEGESVIAELLACLSAGREPSQISGLVFRNAAGEVVRTSGWSQTSALDELPFIDRNLYNLPRY